MSAESWWTRSSASFGSRCAYSSLIASYRGPGGGDLAVGIAGGEQAGELDLAVLSEPLLGEDQQPASAVQRVMFAAAVAEGLLLHPPAHAIELGARKSYQVE